MDENISWAQKCKSSTKFKFIKKDVQSLFQGMEYCHKIITGTLWNIPISPEMKNVIKQKINPIVEDLATNVDEFYRFLKEEMVEYLKYFNSLEKEIESLKSQLELQRTQFSNEIDRLSKEYYYADHMNAILGVIFTTSVSRPQLKSSQLEDRVLHNNSQVKKKEVQDHCRNFNFTKNKTSVTACNDSLNAKTLNINFLVEILMFIIDSRCSKHMTGNLKLLVNFVEKFLDLEVAFWKSTCYVLDLKGNNLLTGSRGSDLYSITLQETTSLNLICLIAKATLSQAWLWHRRLSHLKFDIINLLSKNDIVSGHSKLKFIKYYLCSSLRTDKGTKFLNKTLHEYFSQEGIEHQTSTARTPKQNGVVERRNHTLVDAAQKMLSAAQIPLFFWAEVIATTCFTKNRSLVIPRHEKTLYHIINGRKLTVNFFHIFGSLCYIVKDGENLDKMKEKGDACIFVGHVSSDPAPQCQTTALEHNSLSLDSQSQESVPLVDETVTTSLNELDIQFSLMFDEYFNGATLVVSKSSVVPTVDASDKCHQSNITPSTSTTIAADTTQLDIQTKPEQTTQGPHFIATENIDQA
ncbi:integrase, catalytic region, zinc finger, CCHC-type containing protein [Tanacetum coccineum]